MYSKADTIAKTGPALWQAIGGEHPRQEDHIELIASENHASPAALEAADTQLTNKYAEAALGRARITINKNATPNDPEKPMIASGIRVGTPTMTTRGFKEDEVRATGHLVADVLEHPNDESPLEQVRAQVADLTRRFPVYS